MRIVAALLLVGLASQADLAPPLAAHEKFRIVGTVAGLTQDEIAVKAVDGATYEMDFLDTAAVTSRNLKKVDRATLTVGEKVVALALGHDMFDLEVYEVRLVDR